MLDTEPGCNSGRGAWEAILFHAPALRAAWFVDNRYPYVPIVILGRVPL
jgi:hypothetical protein